MDVEKIVTVIPAQKRDSPIIKPEIETKKSRVAGYARVSTEFEEQQTSYAAQVEYYTKYITSRPDWELVGIYTDEGISATNTRMRDGFNRMIDDALCGKIDLIVTKSVSRFARNTVDCLSTIRTLKSKGIEVYFEKENIRTLDSKGELLITIMSSLAQEESRSISENVTWGHRKRFADGRFSLAYSRFLGYDRDMAVNREEAETVRLIYRLYLQGFSDYYIAGHLTRLEIPTPYQKQKWCVSTVRSILRNEKYKGDALLQKMFTVDFLTKKKKKNEGEVPQYYVKGSHEAIIPPSVFELAQLERLRRAELLKKTKLRRYSGLSVFSTRIKCGECGHWYGPKVWHADTPYQKTILQCNSKYKGDRVCRSPNLCEQSVKELFIKAVDIPQWDETRWCDCVEFVTVFQNGKIVFSFKDGIEKELYLQ
ncbi:MAG: recombinase family protein [Oscillospiraceae bacterium]|nr:recombinase family protein [Oscillospiraceae bacterium]